MQCLSIHCREPDTKGIGFPGAQEHQGSPARNRHNLHNEASNGNQKYFSGWWFQT
jgi:hypothetical protein